VGDDRIGGCGPRRGGELENFHPSPSGHTRHSRHTACHTTKTQVSALPPDLAEALIRTRVTNAKTEAANVTIKNIKRTGRGYRSPKNYQCRIMLYNAARMTA